nr:hypothetical protein [Candidatus Sigynarchaeota archaeon]
MSGEAIEKNHGYVPAERVFVPAVAMPGLLVINDDFIGMVLRVGDKDGAIAAYEHFIGQLRRFTMVALGDIVISQIDKK